MKCKNLTTDKNNKSINLINPLLFDNFSDAKKYIDNLSSDGLIDFNALIYSVYLNLVKFRDYIYQLINHRILESNEISKKKYSEMLKLIFELGVTYRFYFLQCSTEPFIYNYPNEKKTSEETFANLNRLIKLDEENNILSDAFVNKTNDFVNTLINYSNSCHKQVFGKYINKSINSKELPSSIIGKSINDKWDIKSCIDNLKSKLISCMTTNYKGNINDLISYIKKEYCSCSWIEAWSFSLKVKDAYKIYKRLS